MNDGATDRQCRRNFLDDTRVRRVPWCDSANDTNRLANCEDDGFPSAIRIGNCFSPTAFFGKVRKPVEATCRVGDGGKRLLECLA